MSRVYLQLVKRIRGEVIDLDRTVQKALRVWPKARTAGTDSDVYFDSVALNLQSFYTGIERLFEMVARHVDGSVPRGDAWHEQLLQQMGRSTSDIRPAVISQASVSLLDEFKDFRHVVRNIYAVNLIPEKLDNLMVKLPLLWPQLKDELLSFAGLLEAIAEARQE